jgi:hypothetical protein
MNNPIVALFAYSSVVTMLVLGLSALFVPNKQYDYGSKLFRYYFLLAALTELFMLGTTFLKINNLVFANFFSVIQFFMIASAIQWWMHEGAFKRFVFIVVNTAALVFAIMTLGNMFRMEFETISVTLENIILMMLSAIMLFQLTNDNTRYLISNHKFWFTVSVFVYFSVMTVVTASANYVLSDNQRLHYITWNINSVLSIIANILYIKGILCLPAKKTSS